MIQAISANATKRFWNSVRVTDTCWIWDGALFPDGYGIFRAEGWKMRAHRAAWLLATGAFPEQAIDHVCHVRNCVRFDHLREVSTQQNNENLLVASARSSSGFRGVNWDATRQKWRAQVGHAGRHVLVGRYDTVEAAVQAVQEARRALHTHNDLDRL